MIEIPARIAKADIRRAAGLVGMGNQKPVILLDKEYSAASLCFEGFAGAIDLADRQYVGVLRFTPVDMAGKTLVDFVADIPGNAIGKGEG